jgi:hypothetical protein
MVWLILALIAVSGLFFAGYRKSALGIAAAALIAGAGVYFSEQQQDTQATSRIAASELTLENITYRQTFRSSYEMSGRVTNNSETFAVDGIRFAVTLQDCKGNDKAMCAVVGRTTASTSVRVAPQQARDFTASMYFGGDEIKPKGKLAWEYEIIAVVAKRP